MALLQKKYLRVNPLSNRTGASFNSSLDFQWVNSGLDYVNWNETFICARFKVAGVNASGVRDLISGFDEAVSGYKVRGSPAWNAVAQCFKSATQQINSQVVSRCDNFQQADTFVKRITYSNAYRNGGVGNAQSLQTLPENRDYQSAVYGELELELRPNFGLFNQQGLLPPTCLNQLSFEIANQWQKSFIQSNGVAYDLTTTPDTGTSPVNSIDISVADIYLRVCLHQMSESITDGMLDFTFPETQSSNQAINGQQQNLNFSVPPSTYRIGLYLQGQEAGFNTRLPCSLFKTISGDETRIQSLQVTYGTQTLPQPQYALNASAGLTGSLKWNAPYYDAMLASGRAFNETGLEDFITWYDTLGLFFLFQFLKPADDRNTNVQVQIAFNGNAPANTNMWIMASFQRNVKLAYTAGQCASVLVEDI
jgi:hypothetical protein